MTTTLASTHSRPRIRSHDTQLQHLIAKYSTLHTLLRRRVLQHPMVSPTSKTRLLRNVAMDLHEINGLILGLSRGSLTAKEETESEVVLEKLNWKVDSAITECRRNLEGEETIGNADSPELPDGTGSGTGTEDDDTVSVSRLSMFFRSSEKDQSPPFSCSLSISSVSDSDDDDDEDVNDDCYASVLNPVFGGDDDVDGDVDDDELNSDSDSEIEMEFENAHDSGSGTDSHSLSDSSTSTCVMLARKARRSRACCRSRPQSQSRLNGSSCHCCPRSGGLRVESQAAAGAGVNRIGNGNGNGTEDEDVSEIELGDRRAPESPDPFRDLFVRIISSFSNPDPASPESSPRHRIRDRTRVENVRASSSSARCAKNEPKGQAQAQPLPPLFPQEYHLGMCCLCYQKREELDFASTPTTTSEEEAAENEDVAATAAAGYHCACASSSSTSTSPLSPGLFVLLPCGHALCGSCRAYWLDNFQTGKIPRTCPSQDCEDAVERVIPEVLLDSVRNFDDVVKGRNRDDMGVDADADADLHVGTLAAFREEERIRRSKHRERRKRHFQKTRRMIEIIEREHERRISLIVQRNEFFKLMPLCPEESPTTTRRKNVEMYERMVA